ncbi:MAG: NPCBM/NEW2 domain-containing protein, partial [Caldilineaceae bacterium]|nr:NPCBM/NEW2 domain-containing protein [Caldilineaceae bacterium]
NYGVRIRGYVAPPRTGSYTFWIASDDNSELWFTTIGSDSTNPSLAQKLAWVKGATDIQQWDKYPEQQSSSIFLEAGKLYYIEALHKEGSGADYISAAWSGPDLPQQVINEQYLYVYSPNNTYTITYVSDLNPTAATNGWGPYERDTSNGENSAGDGNTLTLNGVTYARGLGVHAHSELRYALNGQYGRFLADIGVDDEVGSNGSVNFYVYLDDALLYSSGALTGNSAIQFVDVDVANANELRLIVTNGGDNINYDHADWANARLLTAATASPTPTFTFTPLPTATNTPVPVATATLPPPPTATPTTPPGAQVIDVQVISSSDDADEYLDNGSVTLNNQALTLGALQGRANAVGIRFRELPIPQGATIVDAYLEFTAATTSTGAAALEIYGHAINDSIRFRQTTGNISSRPRTSKVDWPNVEPFTDAQKYRTPGIKPIVQELVARPGWLSGNNMAFIILGKGTRSIASYDRGWSVAPHLIITYIPPAEATATATYTPVNTPTAGPTETPAPPTPGDTPAPTPTAPAATATPSAATPTIAPSPAASETATLPPPPNTPTPGGDTALDAIQTFLLFNDAERDGVVSPGDTVLVQTTIVNIGPYAATAVSLDETYDDGISLVPGTVRIFEGSELRDEQLDRTTFPIPVGNIGAGLEYRVMFQMLLPSDIPDNVSALEIQGRVAAQNAPTILTRNSTLDRDNRPTVILLGQASAFNKHQYLPIAVR